MGNICPECQQGKHTNCTNRAGIDDNNQWISCDCYEFGGFDHG